MQPDFRPIRAFLFDKDGTLVDAFGGWVTLIRILIKDLAADYGADLTGAEALVGIRDGQVVPGGLVASGTEEELFRALHGWLGPLAPTWEDFFPQAQQRAQALFEDHPPEVRPLGQVKETLAELARTGYRIGLATSDTYANAHRDLADHGAERIEFWATFDRLASPKPHPESVLKFAEAVGVSPSEVAFVGDSAVDLASARAAGVGLFVALQSATCPPEVAAEADLVLTRIDELPGLLAEPKD